MAAFDQRRPQMNMQNEVQRHTEMQRNLVETENRRDFKVPPMPTVEYQMEEANPSVNRRMIPAPLLARVKGPFNGPFDEGML